MANGNFKSCQYRVNKITIDVNGSITELDPIYVSGILIDANYDKYFLPYFEISICLPNDLFREMKKDNTELRCYIDLQRTFADIDMNASDKIAASNLTWESMIEGNFYCYSDDGTPATNEDIIKTYEKSESEDTHQTDVSNMTTTKISLYNEEYLFKSHKTVNAVLQNVDVITALAWICNNADLKNILCSPITNMEKNKELILPPYDAAKELSWVANNYTAHDCGTLVFFGFNRGYLINKNGKCDAWESGEPQKTIIESVQTNTNTNGECVGCCIIGNENHVNMETNALHFSTPSAVETQTFGSAMRIIDASTGEITDVDSGATVTSSGENTKVYTNQVGNIGSDAIATKIKEASKQIDISFTAVDFMMFRPNKAVEIAFTSSSLSDYGGTFRPSAVKAILQKDGDTFIPSVNVTLLGGY